MGKAGKTETKEHVSHGLRRSSLVKATGWWQR